MHFATGPLWIFLFDYGLIGFSAAASRLFFREFDEPISIFGDSNSMDCAGKRIAQISEYVQKLLADFYGFPSFYPVQACCAAGIIMYPMFFLIVVFSFIARISNPEAMPTFLKNWLDKIGGGEALENW